MPRDAGAGRVPSRRGRGPVWDGGAGGRLFGACMGVSSGGGRKGDPVRSLPGDKGCEPTPLSVLMFSMSEGASPKGPEPEDTPNARVAE
ncbi:hypothetical protein GCM10010421_13390 [Streptomyces glaucus]|uniref:Secreted protein n=1 Tax=Streptomyces glaucus TaxID=284029 RepID=A0ABN3JFC1_9ACTN